MNATSFGDAIRMLLEPLGGNGRVLLLPALVVGFALGLATAALFRRSREKTTREVTAELLRETESKRQADVESVIQRVRESFGSLSLEALSRSTEEFLKLAKARFESERQATSQELSAKKGLIDQQLTRMTAELENVSTLMLNLEKDRAQKYGELAGQLKSAGEQTARLLETTGLLREALASTKARGQWGERMAEDVLRVAGFIESVNYLKQKTLEGSGSRPDFTFLLPRDLRLNMDVKFPLDNYLRFLDASTDTDRDRFRNDFLRDVKQRIKEVATRDYIDPALNTVDYALLFIPNEQIYAFIHEQDSNLLEEALRSKVVFCSPITLFAVLAVIRQAIDNFALEETSNEMLALFGAFKAQWEAFLKKLELVGRRIGDAQKEYDALTTTRRRKLERPLDRIEELRTRKRIPAATPEERGMDDSEAAGGGEVEGDGEEGPDPGEVS